MRTAYSGMKRSHGSGHLYIKHGSYYGRWRGVDGRLVNKRIGKVRTRARRTYRVAPTPEERARTVDEVADELRERLSIEGARLSYRQNCESMQRIHISPALVF